MDNIANSVTHDSLGFMGTTAENPQITSTPLEEPIILRDNDGRELNIRRTQDVLTGELRYSVEHEVLNSPLYFESRDAFERTAIRVLREHDIDVDPRMFKKWENTVHKSQEQKRLITTFMHTHLGWSSVKGRTAFIYDDVYTADGPFGSVYRGKLWSAHRNLIASSGNLDEYLAGMREFVVPYPKIMIVYLAGLTGLYTNMMQVDDLNILINVYGETSKGKSVTLRTALSAWGDPTYLMGSWNTSPQGHEESLVDRAFIAYAIDDFLLAYEGLSPQKIGSALRTTIFMLANETTRKRFHRNVHTFYGPTLMSTEEPILPLMGGGKIGGQNNRLIEIPVNGDLTKGGDHAAALKKLTAEHYGLLGPALGRWMSEEGINADILEERYNKIHKALCSDARLTDARCDRLVKRIAVILLVGELFGECFSEMDVPMDEIREILIDSIVSGESQGSDLKKLYTDVCKVYKEKPQFFSDKSSFDPEIHLGVYEESSKGTEIFLMEDQLKKLMQGIPVEDILKNTGKEPEKTTIVDRLGIVPIMQVWDQYGWVHRGESSDRLKRRILLWDGERKTLSPRGYGIFIV